MTQPALFDPIAKAYARYAAITDELFRPWIERHLPVHVGCAADLGCGSGRWTTLLAEHATDVLAVDVSAAELRLACATRSRPNVRYELRSLLDVTPGRDGLFDLVLSVNTLFHLYAEHSPDDVLRHVRSLVAPGGVAVLVDVVSPGDRALWWHRWWGLAEAARTLRRRRSVTNAWAVLALRQHPAWLRHARTNHPLTRERCHDVYADHLPGVRFTEDLDPFTCAAYWRRD